MISTKILCMGGHAPVLVCGNLYEVLTILTSSCILLVVCIGYCLKPRLYSVLESRVVSKHHRAEAWAITGLDYIYMGHARCIPLRSYGMMSQLWCPLDDHKCLACALAQCSSLPKNHCCIQNRPVRFMLHSIASPRFHTKALSVNRQSSASKMARSSRHNSIDRHVVSPSLLTQFGTPLARK